MERAVVGLGFAIALVGTFGGSALGVDNACFDAYEKAQRLRHAGQFLEARDQALVCARDSCPDLIKRDCDRWGQEIARDLPTVVFVGRDDQGRDVALTAVFVDDRKIADSIDGRPVPLDPGPHKVRFESGDRRTESSVQVIAGESNRRVEGSFASGSPTAAGTSRHRGIPTVSWVLGGVAAAGLVSFVAFAIAGRVEQGCSPFCLPGQISTLRAEYAAADVSWITGLVALGGAVAFWVAQPSPRPAEAPSSGTRALRLQWTPGRGGATVGLWGTF